MHELSVTQSLLEIALRHGEAAGAQRIVRLNMVVGELASIVNDSVQFYWDIFSQGTPAEGAQLNFTRVPMEMTCLDCARTFLPAGEFVCPHCASPRVIVSAGEELRVDSIDIE